MNKLKPMVAALLCGLTLGAAGADADSSAPADSTTSTHVTDSGHSIDITRQRHEGEAGGAAVQRQYSVTNPDGEQVAAGAATRWRTAEGDVGHARTRQRTNAEGDTATRRAAAGQREDGTAWRRNARTVTDADGNVQARRVGRAARNEEGGRVRADRGFRQGEQGAQAGRRVMRQSADGQRQVTRQRKRRPNN